MMHREGLKTDFISMMNGTQNGMTCLQVTNHPAAILSNMSDLCKLHVSRNKTRK
jgi:hypothetical protein